MTIWGERKAGHLVAVGDNVLILADTPDWVRLPPALGGHQVRVVRSFVSPCPVTGVPCRHLELEDGWFVAESDQFHWYKAVAD